MIPNGKEMNWNGHKLVFESENNPCRGCFFDGKAECHECDEGVWVEENPSPWHTGNPTKRGWYLTKVRVRDCDGTFFTEYEAVWWDNTHWMNRRHVQPIEGWQVIELSDNEEDE